MPEGAKSAHAALSPAQGEEAVFAIDETLNFTLANHAASVLLSASPGLHATQASPPWAPLVRELEKAIHENRSFYRTIAPEGLPGQYHVSATMCRGGAVVRLRAAAMMDPIIAALGAAVGGTAHILDTSGMGVFVIDASGAILAATPNFAAMLEYAPEELVGRNTKAITHPEDVVIAPLEFGPAVEQPRILEKRYLRKSGAVVFVRIATVQVPGTLDGRTRALCFAYDITAEKARELAVRQSEWRFRSIVENMEDLVSISDAEGTITYTNPAAERMLGYRTDDRIGQRAWDIVHPDDVAAVRREWSRCISLYGSHLRTTTRVRHKDGSWRTVEVLVLNLLHNPAVAGVLMISHDITDRLAARNRMRDYTLELEQRNRDLLQHMASPVRHAVSGMVEEIHTPLVGVGRLVDLLLATRLEASQRECTEHIQDSIAHLLKVVEQMLGPTVNARLNGLSS